MINLGFPTRHGPQSAESFRRRASGSSSTLETNPCYGRFITDHGGVAREERGAEPRRRAETDPQQQ